MAAPTSEKGIRDDAYRYFPPVSHLLPSSIKSSKNATTQNNETAFIGDTAYSLTSVNPKNGLPGIKLSISNDR
jgi:hypothetical protein